MNNDLISRSALKKAVINNFDNLQAYFTKDFIEEIDNAPTVDINEMQIMATINQYVSVDKEELIKALNYDRQQYEKGYQEGHVDGVLQAEKLYARPIGAWEEPFERNGKSYHKCTHCHISTELILISNYCPNCGADMRGGNE